MSHLKPDIKELSLADMQGLAQRFGQPAYRGEQLYNWLFHKRAAGFEEMSDLPQDFRGQLSDCFRIFQLQPAAVETSQDGTRKMLFQLSDGQRIEAVLIPERDHWTLCLSSQVGCAMGCKFCRTGAGGLRRNLTPAEIVGQVQAAFAQRPDQRPVSNLVFMGMGEPLANLDNLILALKVIIDPKALAVSWRKVTVSTVGLPEAMLRLLSEVKVRLAVSLNAPNNRLRDEIMPLNRSHPLERVIEACQRLPLRPGERITFEYVLLAGVNDSLAQARDLVRLLAPLPAKVNLIPFNEHPACPYKAPAPEKILAFQERLLQSRLSVFVRRAMGADISAACGLLHAHAAERNIEPL